ncbi:Aerobic respiration control sensor protein ArcB [Aquisphaera giovannonii]|uniref:histidine kinase n=1 Tax=Aquisphaera giovannonii TaxID=406548 RepID=A0A5B9WCR6_9BACT|nr:PAS domain S-box protein [Aquisphaera giovannonii]QEH37670.1 Aerobic respiration control sensor protein ArcB [Aquisphaera giovannonii]
MSVAGKRLRGPWREPPPALSAFFPQGGEPETAELDCGPQAGEQGMGPRDGRTGQASLAVVLASIALGLLVESLLGPDWTAAFLCLGAVAGVLKRVPRPAPIVAAAMALAANTWLLPSAAARAYLALAPGIRLVIWCLEGLLINWLLVRLVERASGDRAAAGQPSGAMGADEIDESSLRRLMESSSRSQEQLRLMVESIGEFAIIMLTPEGRVASWNIGAARILGYHASEIIGRDHSEFFVAEDVARQVPGRLIAAAEQDGTLEAEGWRRRKDGSRLWASVGVSPMRNDEGEILGFATVVRDVTEKRDAEQALLRSKDDLEVRVRDRTAELAAANAALEAEVAERIQAERVLQQQSLVLRSILDSIGDAVIVAEGDGKPLTFNASARALFGVGERPLTAEDWLGLDMLKVAESAGAPGAGTARERPLGLALRGQRVDDLEITLKTAGGGPVRWLLANSRGLRRPAGESRGAVVAFRDITERRRQAEEVRAAKETAERACRARDQFLAMLSHELRTPLTPILLATSSLLEREGLAAELGSSLELIHRNARLEARLIDDLLDLTRATTGRLSLVMSRADVHRAIRLAAEVCRPAIEDCGVELRLELEATLPEMMGDPARLQQVFWNLIKNAVKFTPEGGRVTIRTRNVAGPEGGPPRFEAEVIDTGIGIDPARLPTIFTPFASKPADQRRFGGLGLGLAISRSVVEAHGGHLACSSGGEGRGATFTVRFETCEAAAAGDAPQEVPGASLDDASAAGGLAILLVEDNRDTLHYLSKVLGECGHVVNPAGDYRTARRLAEACAFDLVISDIDLPDGTGLDLMRELTDRSPTAGIALSGFGSAEDVAMSLRSGFSEHLTKPIEVGKLHEAIRRVAKAKFGGRLGSAEAPPQTHGPTAPPGDGRGRAAAPAASPRVCFDSLQQTGR